MVTPPPDDHHGDHHGGMYPVPYYIPAQPAPPQSVTVEQKLPEWVLPAVFLGLGVVIGYVVAGRKQ